MRLAVVITALMAMAGLAFAQSQPAPAAQQLTADELRTALIGTDMTGTYATNDGPRWRECVAQDATTVYLMEGEPPDYGRLTITEEDQACYSYASSSFSRSVCYRVFREAGAGLRFEDAEFPIAPFLAKQLRRVRTCDHLTGPGA